MDALMTPKAGPTPVPELVTFLQPYRSLFRRAQSWQSLDRYLTGLLTDLPRKNCDTIAAAVAGTSTERLQHLLTDAAWHAPALDERRVQQLLRRSPRDGILVIDDTALPKKGKRSVGVQPQYCGTLGKIANCQVVVSAEYVADVPTSRTPVHWPVTGPSAGPMIQIVASRRMSRPRLPSRPSRSWRSPSLSKPAPGRSRFGL
jgi:hypothetical protein